MFGMVAMFEDKINSRYECMNSGHAGSTGQRFGLLSVSPLADRCIFLWQSKNNPAFFFCFGNKVTDHRLLHVHHTDPQSCALKPILPHVETSRVGHALAALWAAQLTHHRHLLCLRRCLFLSWNLKLPALRDISSAVSLSILTTFVCRRINLNQPLSPRQVIATISANSHLN